jgi:hypothetical protein
LRAPRRDAEELEAVLRDEAIGAFRTEVLLNPSAQLLRERLDTVFTEAQHDDVVLLYVSGHGVKDRFSGQLHFATTDTRNHLLASTAVSAQFVRERIDHSLAAQVVVWLDCCYGGAFPSGMLPRSAGSVDVVEQLEEGRGCVVMTASTHIQWAYEPVGGGVEDRAEPSVFTKAIIEGLRTGEADLDGDGEISDRDLYGYVYERVRRESPDQTPTHSGVLSGDLRIAHAGTPLPRDLPDELRRLLRSTDPALRLAGVRLLGTRADEGNQVARTALEVLATGPNPDLATAARDILAPPLEAAPVPAPLPTPSATPAPTAGTGWDSAARPPFAGAAMIGQGDRYLAFDPTTGLLASGFKVWSTRTWRQVHRVSSSGPAAFSADGRQLANAGAGRINVYHLAPFTHTDTLKVAGSGLRSLSFSHDGTLLAATWSDRTALWQKGPDGWAPRYGDHPSSTRAFRFAAGSPHAVAASAGEVSLWDTRTWQRLGGADLPGVELVAVSADGGLVAAASKWQVVVWRTEDWSTQVALDLGTGPFTGPLAFSPDLRDLAFRRHDGLELWDLDLGEVVQRIPTDVAAAAFGPDGRFLAGTAPRGGFGGRDVWVWAREPVHLAGLKSDRPLPPTPARHLAAQAGRRRGRLVAGGVSLAAGTAVPATQAWAGTATTLGVVLAGVLYVLLASVLKRAWTR